MMQLIRRFCGTTTDSSSHYQLLNSDMQSHRCWHRGAFSKSTWRASNKPSVPEGHVPVYVGDDMERFVIGTELLSHPVLMALLEKSAQEYGYEQEGGLRIPCDVFVFKRVMEAVRLGLHSLAIEDLLSYLKDDEIFWNCTT